MLAGSGDNSDDSDKLGVTRGGHIVRYKSLVTMEPWRPLTGGPLKDPVSNGKCNHRDVKSAMEVWYVTCRGFKDSMLCPVIGCKVRFKHSELVPDKWFALAASKM